MISKNEPKYSRYAIYFNPRVGSALAEFGQKWFDDTPSNQFIAGPKRYGFHATLKAPFQLNSQRTFEELVITIKHLVGDFSPVDVGPLVQTHMGGFIALVPKIKCPDLNQLAFDWVRLLDPYHAPADAAELERHRTAGLSESQEEMLQKWSYPYVDKCFRFHITLTEKLNSEEAKSIQPTLDELLKPVLEEPLVIEDVCLLGDPGNGEPFMLLERFSLTG